MASRTGTGRRRDVRRDGVVLAAGLLVAVALAGCTGSTTPTSTTPASTTPGSTTPASMAPSATGRPGLGSCTSDGVAALCGTLRVRESRATNRQIPIRVVVFPATRRPSAPDPVVWFAGGPGDSAVDAIHRVRPLLAAMADRDLVFVEQRGTGASKLTCPPLPGLDQPAALRAGVASCLHGLNADLASYTTAESTDDLAAILTDLRYDKANLAGISYGATVAQTFLLRHPDRVRTMTLLSGSLLDVPVFERFPGNAQAALNTVFAECAAEPACHRAFPRLPADWAALWRSISQHPWVVPADRSPDGTRAVFDTTWLAPRLHRMLTVASSQAELPLLVHLLGASTDRVATILAVAKALPAEQATAGGNPMLAYATRCTEPWARDDPDRLTGPASFEYAFDRADARWMRYVCGLMPRAAAAEPRPHPTGTPVLALNGTADPQDPPANLAGARRWWPNTLALAVPGQGHDLDERTGPCVAAVLASFVERGGAHPATSCLSRLGPPRFALTLDQLSGASPR